MKLIEKRLLRGPNRYALHPVLLAVVDASDSGPRRSTPEDLSARLQALFAQHGAAPPDDCPGSMGGALAWTVLAMQRAAGGACAGFFAASPVADSPGRWRAACAYELEAVAVPALAQALDLVTACCEGAAVPDLKAQLHELRSIAARERPSPAQAAILDAAARHGIPTLRLADDPRLLQLGWGARAQRLFGTTTAGTGQVATDLTSDRALARELIGQIGLPVPRGAVVVDADAAVAFAMRLRRAVVIKPVRRVRVSRATAGPRIARLAARGISLNVVGAEAVRAAFGRAAAFGRRVLLERQLAGASWRAQVVADRVVGLERLDDSHEAGRPGHGSSGQDPLPRLNPQTARACVRAARAIGLDVAGVDFVCADIERPLEAARGALIGVRGAPEEPLTAAAADTLTRTLFGAAHPGRQADPMGDCGDGRIPLFAVTGTNGKTTTTLAIAHIVQVAGLVTGVTTTQGVFIDGHPVAHGDCTGYFSARTVLTDPQVQAAVLETARGGMAKRGLAFDRSTVGVVLNVQGDHLGQDGIDTLEGLAHLKGLVARTAGRAAVLNADDTHCVAMASQLRPGCEAVYFSMHDPATTPSATLAAHLATGGRAVVVRRDAAGQDTLFLLHGDAPATPLARVDRLPMTFAGLARHNVANALAAAAATWAAGIGVDRIRAGLAGFRPSEAANPLRLNLFRVGGTTVVVDYAHNRQACAAIVATARGLTGGRVIGVVSAPGDRIDEELDEVGRVAAQGFDEVVIYEKDDKRGRAPGEITRRIGSGAQRAGIDPARLHPVGDQGAAIRAGLSLCGPGDLLVYAGATDVRELQEAVSAPVEELVIVERRSPLAADDRSSAAGPAERPERRVDRRPHLVPMSSLSSISASR